MMEIGDIWLYSLRSLYAEGRGRHEHWLILDVFPADRLNANYTYAIYTGRDTAISYLVMETGETHTRVFTAHEYAKKFDFKGNPYYKKVA